MGARQHSLLFLLSLSSRLLLPPSLPSSPFLIPLHFVLRSPPRSSSLNPARGVGSDVSSPSGSGVEPWPQIYPFGVYFEPLKRLASTILFRFFTNQNVVIGANLVYVFRGWRQQTSPSPACGRPWKKKKKKKKEKEEEEEEEEEEKDE